MKITDFIPHGRKNAISGVDLQTVLNLDSRTVKKMIADARLNGAVICSILDRDNGGYFLPKSPDEAIEYVRTEQKRIESAKRALEAAEKYISSPEEYK